MGEQDERRGLDGIIDVEDVHQVATSRESVVTNFHCLSSVEATLSNPRHEKNKDMNHRRTDFFHRQKMG